MNLSKVLAQWRWAQKLSVREAASVIGLPPATLSRLERGEDVSGSTLGTVLAWLLAKPHVEPEQPLLAEVSDGA